MSDVDESVSVAMASPPQRPTYRANDKLKTPEAADYCMVSVSLLHKLRIKGGGPAFYVVNGKLVQYAVRDLDEWLEQDKRKSTSAPLPTPKRRGKSRR